MPSVVPFRGDYGFHNSLSALKRIQEDMNLHAHNIATGIMHDPSGTTPLSNANTQGFNPNQGNTLQEDKVSISSQEDAPENQSRVNLAGEASKLKEDEQYYRANAKAIKVQNDTLGSLLDLKA